MSWLTWWKKDEKKEEKEEKPVTASLYYLYRNNCTEVSRNKMYGDYTFTVQIFPEIVPIYLLTRQVSNRHALYAEVTQRDIGNSVGAIPVGQSFGTITYKIPKMGIYHGNSLKFNNNSNYTYTVTQFKIIEAGTTNIWHDCSNWSDIKIIIEDLYTRVSYDSNTITLNENEQKITGCSSLIPAITVTQEEKIQKQINRWLLINNIYKYGSNSAIVLELEGVIPLWVYDRMLPLSTKGFVNSDGTLSENETDYHIIKINDTFYKNIENSIDFGKRDDINLDNFEGFYVKYVRILYTYQEEIEENHTFQYWEDGVLKDSIIEYYPRESEDIASISNVDYILTIHFNPQTENDFLDNYIKEENGKKILVFDMKLTDLDEDVQSLTEYSFRGSLIIIDQMIKEENGNEFTIECCSEQVQGIHIICSTETIEYPVYPNYKITNLYCINTNDLNLDDELPEVELTLSTQDYIKLTYDNLYLTNLKGSKTHPATNTNLLLEGNITSIYQYLPLKKDEYPENYKILKGVDTINDSPVPNEYLLDQSFMNLIDDKNVDISKFGTVKKSDLDPNLDVLDKQNVFLSSILVYDNEVNKKVKSAGLMSRNEQVITGGLGDGEVNYAPTNVDLQRDDIVNKIENKTILTINEQNCNNFLKSVTKNESGTETIYTDIYLNQECSSSFQENSKNTLRVSILYLLNEYTITFNEKENMGKLRIHYIKSNPTNEDTVDEFGYVVYVPSNPKYEVTNLYVTSGTYKDNTSNLIPHPVNWTDENDENEETNKHHVFNKTEDGKMSIDLMYKKGLIYVVDVGTAYCINTLVTDEDKDYECYLIVSGEIPQWVFKDLLPLPKSIDKQGNVTSTYTKKDISGINMYVSKIGVSKTDNTDKLTESEIDLTNIADLEVLDRIRRYGANYYQKVFFVNKVKVLERFEGKIDTEGVDASFQYYDGKTENPSTVEFVDDWALKLPECYESCEVSGTELTVKFGEYLQIDYDEIDYLLRKLQGNLDLSMKLNSNLDLSNVTTLNIYLKTLKHITWSIRVELFDSNDIWIIYNKNGFLERKEIDTINQIIDNCYLIYETRENITGIVRDNILIKPNKYALVQQNKVLFHDYFYTPIRNMTINNLECTNVCQSSNPNQSSMFSSNTKVNLLVSGVIPSWLGEYFYSNDAALPIKVKSGSCQLEKSDDTKEVTKEHFMITSINALPAPGIGIANSDPDDQCSLNLKDFMPQSDSGGTGNDGGDNDTGGGDSTNDGGTDPSGGSTGD